jgi:hypothetical protein
MIVYSDFFVVHEITGGPFLKEQTFFAEWAPIEDDKAGVDAYLRKIIISVKTFNKKTKV